MAEETKYGEWLQWPINERPEGLEDAQRIQVCYINYLGELHFDSRTDRSVGSHVWKTKVHEKSVTLAYRKAL